LAAYDMRSQSGPVIALSALALLAVGFLAGARFGARRDAAGSGLPQRVAYRCPMHPAFLSERPGECPSCRMALVAVEPAAAGAREDPQPVPGRAAVVLSAERRQLLGVRSEAVRRVPLDRMIRTVGRVAPDEMLDPKRRWILADVHERDLAGVRVGTSADATLPHLPGQVFNGSLHDMAPVVDGKTRSIRVRIEVEDRDGALKPGMLADVFLRVSLGPGLAVNQNAVIDAGLRRLVFLDRGEGRYEPREVTLGARAGPLQEVLEGLSEGDRVVTSAHFLLDSESSLSAAAPPAAPR
jgi:multidrug efflux pump subunit AcrA (membrane-fusion protein)